MKFLRPTDILYPDTEGNQPIADLDWATGMLRFFIPYADFRRIINSSPDELTWEDRYALEALTHERFGYDFSTQLFDIVVAAARTHRTLDDTYAHRDEFVAVLEPLFATLDRKGPHGLRCGS